MAKFDGGITVTGKGYLKIKAGPHREKYVHIMVAEAMLGRELKKDEDVDHYDGDKLNCDWRNLRVRGKSEHGAVSNRQKWFLKNREMHEREQWAEWIAEGGIRPDHGKLPLDDAGTSGSEIKEVDGVAVSGAQLYSQAGPAENVEVVRWSGEDEGEVSFDRSDMVLLPGRQDDNEDG